jgi:Tol biopolymer transport system component
MLSSMNISKQVSTVSSIILIMFLVACGTFPSKPTSTSAPTVTLAATPVPSLTQIVSTPTVSPATLTPTPTSLIPISSAPDGLRMAYIIDGNLYLQDGNNSPIQLTDRGEDRQPTFSDDGKKIVFLRGFIPHDLYSINSDGSQEQVAISGNILSALGAGYSELSEFRTFAFVPGTHLVIFDTRELDELDVRMQDWNRTSSKNKDDLLIVDTDTGEIKSLLAPGQGGNFFISPDGDMIAVQARRKIDVVSIDGQMIRPNLVSYVPTQPYELLPDIFWVEDSTELIVTLPVGPEYNMDGPETRSVWRYSIDGKTKVQVSLNPPPIDSDYSVSPDGNWILYSYYHYPGKTDESVTPGLYLGNLREGSAELYSQDVVIPTWSPDSSHFVYDGLFLGAIDSPPKSIGEGSFLGWSDANHYLYFTDGMIAMEEIGGPTKSFSVDVPESSIAVWPYLFTFVFLNR